MTLLQAVFYLAALVLLVLGAFPLGTRVNLALLGAACALFAYLMSVEVEFG